MGSVRALLPGKPMRLAAGMADGLSEWFVMIAGEDRQKPCRSIGAGVGRYHMVCVGRFIEFLARLVDDFRRVPDAHAHGAFEHIANNGARVAMSV
jgi:hypothetical protein